MNVAEDPEQLVDLSLSSQVVPETGARPTLLCLSHLRWEFVYQRPQHVMSRLADAYNVIFFEEPVFAEIDVPRVDVSQPVAGIEVAVPQLPMCMNEAQIIEAQRQLVNGLLATRNPDDLLLWYFTPMSLAFTDHLRRLVTVYDCMDELSAFRGAPRQLVEMERRLMKDADVVFTGGYSLWEVKKRQHANAHPVPSSVDLNHFNAARQNLLEPEDQIDFPHPRLGFFGVIDERFDITLIEEVAALRPDWQIVLIGPVVKIDPTTLPRLPNIHYLGSKQYAQLPAYLSGWDVALMPFAINESTRFISPTKTPEYLAGGCPVVSTPIRDVVTSYGQSGVVTIAENAEQFINAIQGSLKLKGTTLFVERADAVLSGMSWDKTSAFMKEHIECLR